MSSQVREHRIRCSYCERFITMLVPLGVDVATLPTDGQCSSPEDCYPTASFFSEGAMDPFIDERRS